MKTLVNLCCAPCGLPLIKEIESPTLFFYNPNISPLAENDKRLAAAQKVAQIFSLPLIEGDYGHTAWLAFLRSKLSEPLESYSENGLRCQACYGFRLDRTACFAREHGFDAFAATLSVNRFKDTSFIDHCGEELAQKYSIAYYPFKRDAHEAHKLGLELSRQHNVYRQKYCGCEFSLPRQA